MGEPVYRGQQQALVVVSVLMTVLGAIALVLRVIGRSIIVRRLGADDVFMIISMLLTGGYLFEILYGQKFGMGLHGANISLPHMVHLLKIIYSIQLTYNTIVATVKISIVLFYLRLASIEGRFRTASWGTIIFLVLFYVSTQTATALQCLPIESLWDITGTMEKKCFDTQAYFYIVAVVNIATDIWILVLPINTLKSIKRPTREKIVLGLVFGVGAFSCISSIIRLYTIKVFASSKDPFYDGVPINIWSMIEVNVAIICASVPAMKPLFTKSIRERATNSKSNNHPFGSRYGHQMIPLGDKEDANSSRNRGMLKPTYSVKAAAVNDGGSEENIVSKSHGGIEYEREFVVEESYVGASAGHEASP